MLGIGHPRADVKTEKTSTIHPLNVIVSAEVTRLGKEAPDFKASQNHIAKPRPVREALYLQGIVTWTRDTELGRPTLNTGWGSLQWDCALSQKEGQTEHQHLWVSY